MNKIIERVNMAGACMQMVATGRGNCEEELAIQGLPTFLGITTCSYAIETIESGSRTDGQFIIGRHIANSSDILNFVGPIICKITMHEAADYNYADIFESVELLVGGVVIEKQTAAVMQALNKMPIIRDGNILYVNLPLWFCNLKNITQTLPLFLMQYQEVRIHIKTNPKIVLSMLLLIDYIHLHFIIRRQMKQTPHDYVFYQYDEITRTPSETGLVPSDECIYLVESDSDTAVIKGVKKQFRCENGMGQLI